MNHFLFKPLDIASLAFFRLVAGILLACELINQILTGDFNNYLEPEFNFSYLFFPWLKPLPPTGMYLLVGATILAALFVAAGYFYRVASILLFIGYTTLFLMEETEYVNHFYLYCLLCLILIFLPANRALSIDAIRKPGIKRSITPAWTLYILIFQISIVYFYAGLAKLHTDWLLARPLTLWMAAKASRPVIGPVLAFPETAWVMSYAGILFDLLFAPLLIYRKTRWLGLTLAILFHVSNAMIFGLATFPWFSLLLTSLYFSPSWPRKLPVIKKHLPAFNRDQIKAFIPKPIIVYLLGLHVVLQVIIPFRHFLYPGDVNWTEEGHKFSWHMMLRSKSGTVTYNVVLPSNNNERIVVYPDQYLTPDQARKLSHQPDLILQFGHFLGKTYQKQGYDSVEVYALTSLSLNGRPYQPIIDEKVNLMKQKRSLGHYSWILPLVE